MNLTVENGRKHIAGTLSLLLLTLGTSGLARAGCPDPSGLDGKIGPRPSTPAASAHFSDAVYRPGQYDSAGLVRVSSEQNLDADIVGLWSFEWRAKADPSIPNDNPGIPDGALLDFGTIQWHEDGTEITVSGGRTPAVGDVCMGVWKQVGHSTFKLTHWAMGYGPPPGPVMGYQGLAVLEMRVDVDPNDKSYHGHFTLTQYLSKFDPNVPGSEFDQSTPEFVLSGTVTAQRIAAH